MATMTTPSMPPPLPPRNAHQSQTEPQWKRVRPLPEASNTRADVVAYRSAVVHSKTPTQLEYLPDALLVVDHSQHGLILDLIDVAGKDLEEVDERAAESCAHEIIEFKGRIIMPGFIDTHAHAPQYAFTGTGMNLPLLKWYVLRPPLTCLFVYVDGWGPPSFFFCSLPVCIQRAGRLTPTPTTSHILHIPPGWRRTPSPASPSSRSWTSPGRCTPSRCAAT